MEGKRKSFSVWFMAAIIGWLIVLAITIFVGVPVAFICAVGMITVMAFKIDNQSKEIERLALHILRGNSETIIGFDESEKQEVPEGEIEEV